MKSPLAIWRNPSDEAVRSFGTFVIYVTFAVATLVILYLAWKIEWAVPLAIPVLLAGPVLVYLFRRPLLNLSVVLVLFVLILRHEEGFQVSEVLYGAYYLGFLAHWFLTRLVFGDEPVLVRPEDKTAFTFLVLVTLWIPLTFVFGGEPMGILSEWVALMFLGLFFPIKEACVRYRHGAHVVVACLLWIGLFAAVRNVFLYERALSDAAYAWQIMSGRVWMNDGLLMVVCLLTVVLVIHARRTWQRVSLGGVFLAAFLGLILTQSRSMWVAFALGCGLIFLAIDRAEKQRLLLMSAASFGVVAVVALVFFGDLVGLVLVGLLDRMATLGTALTDDISLINRFAESRAVLSEVLRNPVVGYGMAVPFEFHDLTHRASIESTFIHNGYLSLWYKFGILGLGLMLFLWVRSAWNGFRTFRAAIRNPILALSGLGTAVGLTSMMLTAHVSNPFYLVDTVMTFALLTGLASGVREAADQRRADDPET